MYGSRAAQPAGSFASQAMRWRQIETGFGRDILTLQTHTDPRGIGRQSRHNIFCVQRAVGEERLGRFQQRDRRRSPERCKGWRNHRSTAKTSSPRTCFSPYARHSRHCTCSCPPIERIPVSYPKVEAAGQVWQETSALLAWRSSRTTALTPRMLKKA